MWTFFSLFLFIIFLFSPLTAGTDGFDILSAGGGGGGGDDGAEHQQASNNPFILADASSELQKTPTDERNKQECRRSEFGGIGNSNVIINNNNNNNNNRKQARRDQQKNSGVCANDNTVVIPLTEEPKKPQTTTPQIQPSEDSGGRRGGRRGGRKPGPKPKDYSTNDFPADDGDDDEDIGPAFNFSPAANPNICKDPSRPIPVCHNLVQSFSGDLDDVLFELARCYPC